MCDHEQSDITCVCICITKAVILRGGWSEIMGMEGSKPVPRDSPTHSAASQRLIIALFFLIQHSQFSLLNHYKREPSWAYSDKDQLFQSKWKRIQRDLALQSNQIQGVAGPEKHNHEDRSDLAGYQNAGYIAMQEVWMEQNITGARMRSVSPRRHTWLFLCSYAPQRTFLQLPVALPCTESGNLWIVGLATWIYLTNPLFPHKHHLLFRPSLSFSFS